VTFHDFAHPGRIRRRRAADRYSHFPEEFRPENAWRENAEHFRNRLRLVDEPVDNTARDEEIVSGLDLDSLAGDRPSDDAFKTIDCFFPVTVMVGDRHTGVWRDHHLKHIKRPAGIIFGAQKPQLHCANLDKFSHCRAFRYAIEKIAGRLGSSAPKHQQESLWPELGHVYWAMMSDMDHKRRSVSHTADPIYLDSGPTYARDAN
jgi:hypothetical protein